MMVTVMLAMVRMVMMVRVRMVMIVRVRMVMMAMVRMVATMPPPSILMAATPLPLKGRYLG